MPQSAELAKLKEELKEELRAEVVRELLRSSVLALRAQMTAELKAELSDQLYADVSERLAQRAEGSNFSLLCANSIDLEDRPSRAVPVADVQGQARKEIELVAELDRHLAARDASPPERQASSHPCGRLVDAGEVELSDGRDVVADLSLILVLVTPNPRAERPRRGQFWEAGQLVIVPNQVQGMRLGEHVEL